MLLWRICVFKLREILLAYARQVYAKESILTVCQKLVAR